MKSNQSNRPVVYVAVALGQEERDSAGSLSEIGLYTAVAMLDIPSCGAQRSQSECEGSAHDRRPSLRT